MKNYVKPEQRDEINQMLYTMHHEWVTGVGPAGQIIMRPLDRLKSQMARLEEFLDWLKKEEPKND